MTTANSQQHDRKRHHLHSLYMLSKDIERNKSDNDFVTLGCEQGGKEPQGFQKSKNEIVYFVDSNIAISFVSPYTNAWAFMDDFGSFRMASGRYADSANHGTHTTDEDPPDIRSILLMLSTEYIFSEDLIGKKGGLHLTPWHRQEVTRHMFDTHSECMRRLSFAGGKSEFTSQIVSKLRSIAASASPGNETEFLKFAIDISTEETVVPLHLIERVLDGKYFRSGTATREYEKRKRNATWNGIVSYKSRWKRGSAEAVDASSLSYLQWIADNALIDNERLVFITMDDELADWYNSWFNSDHSGTGYAPKNYIVRRLAQYLPQLNLTNAKNILSEEETEKSGELFNKIRQIVELIIAPDMMRLLSKKFETLSNEDFAYYASRHRMSAGLKRSVEGMLNGLAEIEAKSIFLFGEYISRRTPQKLLEIATSLDDDEAAEEIERYISERSDPQHAIAYFAEELPRVDQTIWRRIPQTLHFPVGGKRLYEFIQDSIDNGAVDREAIKHLSPSAIFAICAAIIHATKNDYASLRFASRYAQLCYEFSTHENGTDRNFISTEARFLCALSNRFLIGHSETIEAAIKHHRKALTLLDQLSADVVTDKMDAIRFDAEKGASLLFIAAQNFMNGLLSEGSRYLRDAETLLESCQERGGLYDEESDPASEIKRHYTHNLAAIYVLKGLVAPISVQEKAHQRLGQSVSMILESLESERNPPLFLQAELYYFLALYDGLYLQKARDYIDQYLSSAKQKLIVDRWQAERMSERLTAFE